MGDGTTSLDALLHQARAIARARHPLDEPGAPEVMERLRIARVSLLDDADRHPESRLVAEYLAEVEHAIRAIRGRRA